MAELCTEYVILVILLHLKVLKVQSAVWGPGAGRNSILDTRYLFEISSSF